MKRLLLVEFAATDRPQRGVLFPYLSGWARRQGLEVSWLRYGVPAAQQFLQGEEGIGLAGSDLRRLEEEAVRHPPFAVVFSHLPARSLLEAALAGGSGTRFALTAGNMIPGQLEGSALTLIDDTIKAWSRFLEVTTSEDEPGSLFQEGSPHFGYTPANGAAETLQPLPYLIFGSVCTYRRSLGRNPAYADVDLSSCGETRGCAFCSLAQVFPRAIPFSKEEAKSQLEALRATLPPWPGRLSVHLVGDPPLTHVSYLGQLIMDIGFPPSDWQLDSRADVLTSASKDLDGILENLAGTGHRLQISLMGVENFSPAELQRMNKGTTPQLNLEAIEVLLRLERDHPETFSFREFGGLSTILYTPWTTLEDLRMNLALLRNCQIGELCGKLLISRLRLIPGLPITALARKEALTIDSYGDPLFETARLNLYNQELPWRFADGRMAAACSLLIRLPFRSELAKERLYQRVQQSRKAAEVAGLEELDVALALVDAMERWHFEHAGDDRSAPDLLRWLDLLDERLAQQGDGTTRDGIIGGETENLIAFIEEGLKPVAKLEQAGEGDMAGLLARWGPRKVLVRPKPGGGRDLFIGENPELLQRMERLCSMLGSQGGALSDEDARAEIGKLLGYPPCCAEAHSKGEPHWIQRRDVWVILKRRLAHPGEVPVELNPVRVYGSAKHVPCSLECTRTIEVERRKLALLRRRLSDAQYSLLARSMANPWLIMLDNDGQALELLPKEEPGNRFGFEPGLAIRESPELRRAFEADEIVIEPFRLLLLREGRLLWDLTMRAFVWWHRRAFQRELWSAVLSIKELAGSPHPFFSDKVYSDRKIPNKK